MLRCVGQEPRSQLQTKSTVGYGFQVSSNPRRRRRASGNGADEPPVIRIRLLESAMTLDREFLFLFLIAECLICLSTDLEFCKVLPTLSRESICTQALSLPASRSQHETEAQLNLYTFCQHHLSHLTQQHSCLEIGREHGD